MSNLRLNDAATWTKGLPHQIEAWNWLQSQLPQSVLAEFALRYRNQYKIETIKPQLSLPVQALKIIEEFEGFRSTPYLCSAGVPTIGIGTTVYPNGVKVTLSDKAVTYQTAVEYLTHHINNKILPVLHKDVPFWSSMTDNQRAALISFAYNLGAGFMSTKSGFNTIQSNLKTRSWELIPKTLELYVGPGTSSEAGLRRRRKTEGELWQGQGIFARS
jgi:GH24 family phage-related lysozyme (muramidase)